MKHDYDFGLESNAEFDNEHLKILQQFEVVSQLDLTQKENVEKECAKLITLIVRHFINEEHFMLGISYEECIKHRNDHNKFYEYLVRFCSLISEINELTFKTQMTKLVLAFKHHINNADTTFYKATYSEDLK